MPPPTLQPPPVREERSSPPASARPRAPLTAAPRRAPTGRLTRRAIVLSVGAHVVLGVGVLLLPVIRRDRAPATPPADSVQYVDIASFPAAAPAGSVPAGDDFVPPGTVPAASRDTGAAAGAPPLPFPVRVPDGIAPGGGGEAVEGVGTGPAGGAPRAGAAGGRLGAQYGDPRLTVPPGVPTQRPMTDDERYQARLRDRLGVVNDSIADEAARQRRLRNWTIRDRSGREWGLGPDGSTVIAGRRLPIPLPLPVIHRDRDADNAERERVRRWGEIQDQAEIQDRDAVLRDRARETRRRVDNERRERRGEAAADTTRRGG